MIMLLGQSRCLQLLKALEVLLELVMLYYLKFQRQKSQIAFCYRARVKNYNVLHLYGVIYCLVLLIIGRC